jgi:tetratricopeptide (TPR) repeat protein
MKTKRAQRNSVARIAVALATASLAAAVPGTRTASAPPETPREFFNAGTQQLRAGKLREAEASLETALSSQNQPLQPPALYNLGHVRFAQGVEQLKKGPSAKPTAAQGRAAAQAADAAIRGASQALAGNDIQTMVGSYLRGRGARKELKAANRAVRRALETYGAALAKWQRSANDFKSALELNRADADSQQNAETVERCIAKLVDSLRELEETANAMNQKDRDLGEMLKQLEGRIPKPDMPPGAAGEDEEEDMPNGPRPDQQEGFTREGEEIVLTPEQAAWLLEGFRLDDGRRLPMGQGDTGEQRDPSRRPW